MNTAGKYLERWVDFFVFLTAVYLLLEGFSGLTACRQLLFQELSTEQTIFVIPDETKEGMTEYEGNGNYGSTTDCNTASDWDTDRAASE